MAIKVSCQQCGKSAVFADADAGLTALCMACGARFSIPAQFVDTTQVVPARSADLPAEPALDQAQDAPPLPASRSGAEHRAILMGLLAGAGAVVVLFVVALFIVLGGPDWETSNAAEIRKLKASADSLVLENRLAEAYDAYRKLDEFVGGRTLKNTELREEFLKARSTRERLFDTVLAQNRQQFSDPPASRAVDDPPPATRQVAVEKPKPPVEAPATRAVEIANSPPQTRPMPGDPPPAVTETRPAPPIAVHPPENPQPRIEVGPDRFQLGIRKVRNDWNDGGISDAEIGRAIQKAVDHMLSRFRDGMIAGDDRRGDDSYYGGLNALCVYSLLQASYAIKDERLNIKGPIMRDMIEKMRKSPMEQGHVTYARGIRATALALVNRPEDREVLKADVAYLLSSHLDGSYTYRAVNRAMLGPRRTGNNALMEFMGDNSNAQYGLLGVWSGAEVGIEVNNTYWQAVESHWTRCQNEDGSWSYTGYGGRGNGRLSMTLAGLASLFVTHDYLEAPRYGTTVGRDPFPAALKRGLAHLETEDTAISVEGGYSLYGLERVGLASGFKYFGKHDWYRVLARTLVRSQLENGSWRPMDGWGGQDVGNAYCLLFLARGRHPIMMNKLRYEGNWANRPRDVANLARFGTHGLERPLNWQVVPIARDWTDWTDSPILYVSSHIPPRFKAEELDKIRGFVQAGGMLFTQADGNGIPANAGFEKMAKELFPLYEMKDLPEEHEIFKILYKPSPRPTLRYVSNGSRVLMLHSPTDISQWWQLRQEKSRRSLFELGVNIFLYAAGKADLRNRLASPYIPPPAREPEGGKVRVVRLKYAGNWDPEPMAWTRFARYFQAETDVGVEVVTRELSAAAEIASDVPAIAHLTGTAAYTPTDAEVAAIKKFVERGGVLLVEPTGGSGDFIDSARLALHKAFGQQTAFLPREHPLLTGGKHPGTEDCTTIILRPFARQRMAGTTGRIEHIAFGRGRAIFTPLDLTSGLLGTNAWGIYGFSTDYSCAFVKNLLLWKANGMEE